jgi:hypothetical protein
VRNDVAGHLEIADLNRTIALYQVIDLSRLPARRILDSRSLQELIQNNLITFVSHEEYEESLNQPDVEAKSYERVGDLDEIAGYASDEGLEFRRRSRARAIPRRGPRRQRDAEYVGEDEPLIDGEFADLVAGLPRERALAPQRSIQSRQPVRTSAKSKPVRRVGDESDNGFFDDQMADDLYLPE